MDYDNFLENVCKGVQDICAPGETVSIKRVLKNNSVELDGLYVTGGNSNIAPTVYLNSFYDDFCGGRSMEDIVDTVARVEKENRVECSLEVGDFLTFEKIKDRIIFKLVNTAENKKLLLEVPNRPFLDLSVIFLIFIDKSEGGMATTVIHDNHMNKWNITENELYELALSNMRRIFIPDLRGMEDLLREMLICDSVSSELEREILDEIESRNVAPMYVLTNHNKVYGATGMLYEDLLGEFAKEHGSFYILPSSIHELILVPDACGVNSDSLLDMVTEVNLTQVAKEEVLSDNIYYYDSDSGTLGLINKINNNVINT